jgi:RNA ligase
MTQHVQDPRTGRMLGSIGDGKTRIPIVTETLTATRSGSAPEPGPAAAYDDLYTGYSRIVDAPDTFPMPSSGPFLYDVVDQADYDASLAAGHIRVQRHPDLPYLIHNYTDACTWERGWNPATLACRGLITHADTGEVLARPFRKFFNHDQPEAPIFDLDEDVVVMDKRDGSLAISYLRPDGSLAIATRGSFTSDQANWANTFYQRTYADRFAPNPDVTYLYEIIAPFNRIVLDYGDTEDLVLLGAVDKRTGQSLPLSDAARGWPGPTVDVYPHTTLREVLTAPDRENAEGFVLWNPRTDERCKYKQDDYKTLHRLLTNTTPKHVWEVLSSGQNPDEVFAAAPDEFHTWLRTVVTDLQGQHARQFAAAQDAYTTVLAGLPDGWGRKEFALAAQTSPHRSLLFILLDGRSIDEAIWRNVKPSGVSTVRHVSADAD